MSILVADLRELVVQPVLDRLERAQPGMRSKAAEDLLLGTAAQESQMGRYLRQHPQGPARGLYQMEPATLMDLMAWLGQPSRAKLLDAVTCWASEAVPFGVQIAGNLFFATALARVNYWRKPFNFPDDAHPYDLRDLAHSWKQWWNTPAGDGTEAQFIQNFSRFVQQP